MSIIKVNRIENTSTTDGGIDVDSSGRVGVNTASPGHALQVNGAICATGTFSTPSASTITLDVAGDARIMATGPGGGGYLPIAFAQVNSTGGGYSERARIDSSGRLLVGTSSARSNMFSGSIGPATQVEGSSANTSISSIISSRSDSGGGFLALAHQRSGSVGGNTILQSNDYMGGISYQGNDGSNFIIGAEISAFVDGTPGANDMPGRLVFSTTADGASSPTERMRIDSTGRTIFASNAGGQAFPNATSFVNDAGFGQMLHFANTYGGGKGYATFFYNSTEIGGIIATGTGGGTATGVAYNTASDYRLKENVIPVTDGITRLQQLKPSRFNFIADPDTTVDGFLAHEVQDVVSEAITGEKDAVDDDGNPIYQGIDQSKLVPLLTAALQEAVVKIESLEARLTAAGI